MASFASTPNVSWTWVVLIAVVLLTVVVVLRMLLKYGVLPTITKTPEGKFSLRWWRIKSK